MEAVGDVRSLLNIGQTCSSNYSQHTDMKKRKAEKDPVSDDEQLHGEDEQVEEQHDASVNGTRHKLQPEKLRMHKEQAERKGTIHAQHSQRLQRPASNTGIVYISRIPPHMVW